MAKQLIHALARGLWAIEPVYAESQLPFIHGLLRGENSNPFAYDGKLNQSALPYIVAGGQTVFLEPDTWFAQRQMEQVPVGSVVVVPIAGPIMKEDYCYTPGSMTIARWITQLAQNGNVKGIVLSVDSPGGMVDGTQTLADAIKYAAKIKSVKAVINDGMACSAGYWIVSAADEIIASRATDTIGSIGVYVQLADWEKYYLDEHKLRVISIYADQSDEKNLTYIEALKGNEKLIKREMLNPLAEAFINAVKSNRAGKLNLSAGDPFRGKVFMAEQAKEIGLIDRIASLEEVIDSIASGSSTKSTHIIQSNTMKKFSISAALAGIWAFLKTDAPEAGTSKEVELSDEQMASIFEKANAAIGLEAQVKTLGEQLQAANTAKATLEESVKGLTTDKESLGAQITSLTAEVEKLKGSPGAGPHQVFRNQADTDPNNPTSGPGQTSVDAEARQKSSAQ